MAVALPQRPVQGVFRILYLICDRVILGNLSIILCKFGALIASH